MDLTANIAFILMFVVAGLCMPVDQDIQLTLRQLLGHGVLLEWRGPKVDDIKDCDLTYHVVNSSIQEETVEPFQPLNYTIELDDLQPLTAYQVSVICHNMQDVKFSSKPFNFTTVGEGSTVLYPVTSRPVSTPSMQPPSPGTTDQHPPVLQEKISTSASSLDLALGVLFGFLGAGVLGTLGYFLLKKYRRQQRIRRFLQYRQQENETFTDLDQEEDEGVVV